MPNQRVCKGFVSLAGAVSEAGRGGLGLTAVGFLGAQGWGSLGRASHQSDAGGFVVCVVSCPHHLNLLSVQGSGVGFVVSQQ